MKIFGEILFIVSMFSPLAFGIYLSRKTGLNEWAKAGNAAGAAMLSLLGIYLAAYIARL